MSAGDTAGPAEGGRVLRRLAFLAAVVMAVAVALPVASQPVRPAEAATPVGLVTYLVGDSITYGSGTSAAWRDGYGRRTLDKVCGYNCDSSNSAIVGHQGQCLVYTGCGYATPLTQTWRAEVLDATPTPTTVVVCIGRNDLNHATDDEYKTALTGIVNQASARGIRVIVGTIPPSGQSYQYYWWTEPQRARLNTWIRATFPYTADYEAVLKDPAGDWLWPPYDSGDHIHPGDLGAVRMADMVDRSQLKGTL